VHDEVVFLANKVAELRKELAKSEEKDEGILREKMERDGD
jgi:hypothetical protein